MPDTAIHDGRISTKQLFGRNAWLHATLLGLVAFGGIGFAAKSAEAGVWYTDYGRWTTTQVSYVSSCVWYDYRFGSGDPCYQAVWANSLAIGYYTDATDVVQVVSFARHQNYSCYQQYCVDFYSPHGPNPESVSAEYYVSDYLVHYYPENIGGAHIVHVVGQTKHRNYTKQPGGWWWTYGVIWQ